MEFEVTVVIDAPPERVWAVMSDVERWHEWTASITSVELVDAEALAVGVRARVKQPRLPQAVWQVTSFDPGHSFEWETRNPGMRMVGIHRVDPLAGGGSRATLAVHSSGPIAALLTPFMAGTGKRYVRMEAAGLKQRSEEGERAATGG